MKIDVEEDYSISLSEVYCGVRITSKDTNVGVCNRDDTCEVFITDNVSKTTRSYHIKDGEFVLVSTGTEMKDEQCKN